MDARARRTLEQNGYTKPHRARQITADEVAGYDLILAMDQANHTDLTLLAEEFGVASDHVRLFRSFDPSAEDDAEVPDPYYGGDDGFADVLAMVERAADGVVEFVSKEIAQTP